MSEWAREYFELGYAQRWGLPPVTDRIRREASGLWGHLQLQPGSRVVDLGCGHGRYALALSERGADVVGVDSAVALLRRAQRLSSELRVDAHWVRGDMRCLPLRSESCAAAISIDAFGFFEAEEENDGVLAEAARALVPGGRLGLKVVNGSVILANFRTDAREEREGTVVTISRTLTLEPARMIERIEVTGSGVSGRYTRHQRLYRPEELCAVVERAGLSVAGVFGDALGAAFEPASSPTIWVIGQRE